MNPNRRKVKVRLYTTDIRVEGTVWVAVPPDRVYVRLSDILKSASSRGGEDFLVVTDAAVYEVNSQKMLEGGIPVLGLNKRAVVQIIPEKGSVREDDGEVYRIE